MGLRTVAVGRRTTEPVGCAGHDAVMKWVHGSDRTSAICPGPKRLHGLGPTDLQVRLRPSVLTPPILVKVCLSAPAVERAPVSSRAPNWPFWAAGSRWGCSRYSAKNRRYLTASRLLATTFRDCRRSPARRTQTGVLTGSWAGLPGFNGELAGQLVSRAACRCAVMPNTARHRVC